MGNTTLDLNAYESYKDFKIDDVLDCVKNAVADNADLMAACNGELHVMRRDTSYEESNRIWEIVPHIVILLEWFHKSPSYHSVEYDYNILVSLRTTDEGMADQFLNMLMPNGWEKGFAGSLFLRSFERLEHDKAGVPTYTTLASFSGACWFNGPFPEHERSVW